MAMLGQLLKVASYTPITAWDGRLEEGSLSGFLDRELYRVVSYFSPLTAAVM